MRKRVTRTGVFRRRKIIIPRAGTRVLVRRVSNVGRRPRVRTRRDRGSLVGHLIAVDADYAAVAISHVI